MEGLPETAVSLDELTLDIASDVPCEGIQTEFKDFDGIEKALDENPERPDENHTELPWNNEQLLSKLPVDNNEEDASDNDFEADVPPLLLFPKKEDDDEDFEFEFPDVNPSSSKQENGTTDSSHKTVQFSTTIHESTDEEFRIDSERKENLDPEIFTPRGKVTSEFTATIQPPQVPEETRPDQIFEDTQPAEPPEETKQDREINIIEAAKSDNNEEPEVETDSGTEQSRPSIVTTAEDWEQVQVVVPGFADEKSSKSGAAPVIESKPLAKFSESWSEVSSLNYDDVKSKIKTGVDRRGLSAFTHFLFGPPKLHRDLIPERDLIFCLAATPFDNNSEAHNRVLQTIYRCLTGSKFDCQRYGSHWEEIGFQGQDPSTDLRGSGVLSLLHILYILQEPSTKELARDIYKLSLHPTQNFPFCVMSINITVQCLKVVRDDIYNREFNKRKDVVGTMNCLYAALFLRMYQLWKKGKTIHDSGYVLDEVANYSRKSCKTIFKDLESYEKSGKDPNLFGDQPSQAAFFNVCKEEKCDDKITAELY